ncbi:NYN domain-containing protein [Bradyrhizobium sp. 35]|uniref:LabA-like NYN domain-containing protein n=1 Tax=Bradyrhizobium sp. 35 TaxID=2782670 RepID=UPI001FF817DE|nr:NYN domain-containing protein [Bradyrhizobium sp. 35]MCK1453184.1 NYN domain-containing protein [Bradyrhizobium sp. 35]
MADYPVSKTALFIDGLNLHATSRALGFDVDHKRFLRQSGSQGSIVRAFYYTRTIEGHEFSSARRLIDWLEYNGVTVVTKPINEFVDASGRRKVKYSMAVDLAVDAMELADQVDQMVLVSGDGNFRSLVEAVQRRGVRVTVISTLAARSAMVADELRRQPDAFIELVDLRPKIARIVAAPRVRPNVRDPVPNELT